MQLFSTFSEFSINKMSKNDICTGVIKFNWNVSSHVTNISSMLTKYLISNISKMVFLEQSSNFKCFDHNEFSKKKLKRMLEIIFRKNLYAKMYRKRLINYTDIWEYLCILHSLFSIHLWPYKNIFFFHSHPFI